MIRILHVVTHMNRGGLESMIMNYYRNINRELIQFDFLTHRDYKGDYGNEIESLGGNIYHLPILNPFSTKYRQALSNFLKEHSEYNVIHVHQDCLSSIVLKEAERQGIKTRIAHSHSSSQDRNFKYLIKLFYKRFIPRYATHLLACGDSAGRWMFGGSKFEILNNAIDAKVYVYDSVRRVEMRKQLNVSDETVLVGHVGRFCYPKNHEFLIDIFKAIFEQVDSKLLLVGDGELRPKIEEKIKALGLESKVILTGLRGDVEDLLQAMDVFVFPSIYEGLPVTIIEAQAAGLPCLISDKVPIECKKTSLVQQISLDSNAEFWADAIISTTKNKRLDTYEEIKASGFDIVENARRLQEFYIKADAGEKNVCLY